MIRLDATRLDACSSSSLSMSGNTIRNVTLHSAFIITLPNYHPSCSLDISNNSSLSVDDNIIVNADAKGTLYFLFWDALLSPVCLGANSNSFWIDSTTAVDTSADINTYTLNWKSWRWEEPGVILLSIANHSFLSVSGNSIGDAMVGVYSEYHRENTKIGQSLNAINIAVKVSLYFLVQANS